MSVQKLDNTTGSLKISLRRNLLKEIAEPVVMETHGGYGKIGAACYFGVERGIVFEKDPAKAEALATQRPTWAVYECDCVAALKAGVGAHLPVNVIDIDPYGQPWDVIDAFWATERKLPDKIGIAVNDGLRLNLKLGKAASVHSLRAAVMKFGAKAIFPNYLDVCQWMMQEKAGQRGYTLTRWAGYYCGHAEQMTHYAAVLVR